MNANNINNFWSQFTDACTVVRDLIYQISQSLDYAEISPLKAKLSEIQELITVNASVLPLYDIKRSLSEYDTLNKQMKELELLIQPRQSFQFSKYTMNNFILPTLDINSQKVNALHSNEKTTEDELADIIKKKESSDAMNLLYMQAGSYAIKNELKKTFYLTQSDLLSGADSDMKVQLLIRDCRSIIVSVKTTLGSIRLENISNSIILLGPCSTSCYLENCHDNIICISSHQLRIHNTTNTHLYVKCNSHPIIEDCYGLGFADYSMLSYDGIESHLKDADLEKACCWDNVVDFKWHKDIQSPNFYILPSTEFLMNNENSESVDIESSYIDGDAIDLKGRVLVDQWHIHQIDKDKVNGGPTKTGDVVGLKEKILKTQQTHQMQYRLDEGSDNKSTAVDTEDNEEDDDEM